LRYGKAGENTIDRSITKRISGAGIKSGEVTMSADPVTLKVSGIGELAVYAAVNALSAEKILPESFRPVILLPEALCAADDETLDCVLSHEYCHILHFDPLWKLLSLICLCLYWYLPPVWLLFVLLSRDLEFACDEAVIRKMGGGQTERCRYASVLLSYSEHADIVCRVAHQLKLMKLHGCLQHFLHRIGHLANHRFFQHSTHFFLRCSSRTCREHTHSAAYQDGGEHP
jgi:hypothetical protein